jgi:hypothetical protein
LIAIDGRIDDDRRCNDFGLLMSLNMLIELGDAFDYSGADFAGWARSVGFSRTEVIPLAGPGSAAVAAAAGDASADRADGSPGRVDDSHCSSARSLGADGFALA